MNKTINYFSNIKRLYLYLIIIILIICLGSTIYLYLNKKQTIKQVVKLESNQEEIKKTLKVDIKGYIPNPGVYEMEDGSRVIDAINKAGGLLENSDTTLINLSQKLKDEMTIIIYSKDEIEKYKQSHKEIEYVYIEVEKCPDKINDACINSTNNENLEENSLININNASLEELQKISGIGASKAKDIINYRDTNGKFNKIDDIKNVSGIGDSLFEKIKDSITI